MTKEEVIISLGLDHAGLKSGLAGADYLVQNSVKATMNSIKNIFRINMVSMVFQGLELWRGFSKDFADIWYGVTHEMNLGVLFDKQRSIWRDANKERWTAEEKQRKAEEQNAKDRIKRAILEGENQNVQREIQLMAIADETKREEMRLKFQKEELQFLRDKINFQDNIVLTAENVLAVSKAEQEVARTTARLLEIRNQKERELLALKEKVFNDIKASGNPDAINRANNILNPPTGAPAKNQAYLDNINNARGDYFQNIADQTKNPFVKDQFGNMADQLRGKTPIAGDTDGQLAKMLEELSTLTASIKQTGKLAVELAPRK